MKTKYQAKPMPTRPAGLFKSRKSKTTTVAKQFPFSCLYFIIIIIFICPCTTAVHWCIMGPNALLNLYFNYDREFTSEAQHITLNPLWKVGQKSDMKEIGINIFYGATCKQVSLNSQYFTGQFQNLPTSVLSTQHSTRMGIGHGQILEQPFEEFIKIENSNGIS